MDLLDKLRAVAARVAPFEGAVCRPFDTVFDEVLGPCEVVFEGRPVLMFGSNNYFGLSFHPAVQAAARDAVERFGSGSTGSRVANGTLRIHEELERDFAEETAATIRGLRTWETDEFEHNGLRADGERVLGRLIDLVRGRA